MLVVFGIMSIVYAKNFLLFSSFFLQLIARALQRWQIFPDAQHRPSYCFVFYASVSLYSWRNCVNAYASDPMELHPGPAIAALMKLSFDEQHRQAICSLGLSHIITIIIVIFHRGLKLKLCIGDETW